MDGYRVVNCGRGFDHRETGDSCWILEKWTEWGWMILDIFTNRRMAELKALSMHEADNPASPD